MNWIYNLLRDRKKTFNDPEDYKLKITYFKYGWNKNAHHNQTWGC